jgi:hypothetical protein
VVATPSGRCLRAGEAVGSEIVEVRTSRETLLETV